jgi:hypothetical protein
VDGEPVNPLPPTSPAPRERVPWRSVGTGVISVGTPAVAGLLHPLLGVALAVIEIVVTVMIIVVALFGSQALSDRAFRLLRWFGGRPEPPAPEQHAGPPGGEPR